MFLYVVMSVEILTMLELKLTHLKYFFKLMIINALQVSINTLAVKITTFPQKKFSEKNDIVSYFWKISDVWHNRRQPDSRTCFGIQPVILVEVFEENLASHRYVNKKERDILITFRELLIFFFETAPTLDKQQYLKDYQQCGNWNHIDNFFILCSLMREWEKEGKIAF